MLYWFIFNEDLQVTRCIIGKLLHFGRISIICRRKLEICRFILSPRSRSCRDYWWLKFVLQLRQLELSPDISLSGVYHVDASLHLDLIVNEF